MIECRGEGTLVTYTVVHRAAQSWTGRVPYALGEVELPEGIVVTAEVIEPPPGALRRGARAARRSSLEARRMRSPT